MDVSLHVTASWEIISLLRVAAGSVSGTVAALLQFISIEKVFTLS